MSETVIRFNDLTLSRELRTSVDAAIQRVVDSGWFILGPEVEAFEKAFAKVAGTEFGIGVSSGTDALSIALVALGVAAGDEVITSPLSAAFTGLAIRRIGANPVFADVEPDTLLIDPRSVSERITSKTKAIVPVHLYGNACDMDAVAAVAKDHGLVVVEDAAQAHGARYRDRPVGSLGHAAAFSFYPTKNLGALGDGGFIATDDAVLHDAMKQIRNGGQASRYVHERDGLNARLDEMQAAVLSAKLPYLAEWNDRRRALAARYASKLATTPLELVVSDPRNVSAAHLFVVKTLSRDALMASLAERDVQTLIHYPVPIHRQPAFADANQPVGSCPVAEHACEHILSLPLYPSLSFEDVDRVVDAVMDAL